MDVVRVNLLLALAGLTAGCATVPDRPAAVKPLTRFADCQGCPEMIALPGGSFLMGSPQDEPGRAVDERNTDEDDRPGPGGRQVRVTLPAFAMGAYEVTYGQFRAFVAATGYDGGGGCIADLARNGTYRAEPAAKWNNTGRPANDADPVSCVNWDDATAYVRWLSRATGKSYFLPSEAQFEYARRGGTTTPYFWGDRVEDACLHANVPDATTKRRAPTLRTIDCDDGVLHVAPVGRYRPNPFGLYDITGNQWEWLADCYRPSYADTPRDGRPFDARGCKVRSIRGSAWGYWLPDLRSADRSDDPHDLRGDALGFRVARAL